MPTIYKVEILNHLVDEYEEAQRKLMGAERWLTACVSSERKAWDEYERVTNAGERPGARLHGLIRETHGARYSAEAERNVAREREQHAMRTLCDAVLLAAKGEGGHG